MKSVYVVSDLHMFCKRSQWRNIVDIIHNVARDADVFVFNGDTFDFKWTSLESVPETVEQAIAFLRELSERCPKCRIHVNLGNHDYDSSFIDALKRACDEVPNLTWHPYYLRLGNTVFLHGDVAQRKMDHEHLERYRSRWLHHEKQGKFRNQVYDALFRARAHVAVSQMAFPHRLTMRRVSAYLDDIGHGHRNGVERVYFGHTHVPLNGRKYHGMSFHNGGAPFEGMEFIVLKARVQA
jgi:UDP-2,3-diacylglucosamine hydrolase